MSSLLPDRLFLTSAKKDHVTTPAQAKAFGSAMKDFQPTAWLAQFECNSVSPGRMLTLLPACGFVPAGGSTPVEGEREPGTKQMFHL